MNNTQFKTNGHVEPIYDEDGAIKAYYVRRGIAEEVYGEVRKELIEAMIGLQQSGIQHDHPSIERLEKLIEKITY